MRKKEKIHIEYPLKGSAAMIWSLISTAHGLSIWFADKVNIDGKTFQFYWGKEECKTATLIARRNGAYVRLRWSDDDLNSFFEMRIAYNEITREHILEITDFAYQEEIDDLKDLWGSQIDYLKRQSGM